MAVAQSSMYFGPLPEGWTLDEFRTLLSEPVRNGVYKSKEFHGRGQKIVNMGELFAYDFISSQEMKRVELQAGELEKNLLRDGDLLFARRSLVLEGSGKCSLVIAPREPVTYESSVIRARPDPCRAHPRYYYYLFRSPQGRSLVASIATRTAVSGITGTNLMQLLTPRPPLPVQRKIAAILSAYDDLIENNRRRIAILEEMARSLYRDWFVEFRFPGHEQARMVESPLGSIPEAWRACRLRDIACDTRRPVSPEQVPADTPYVGLEHIPRRSIALAEWGRAGDVQSTKLRFDEGDILFGKIRPYFHKVAVAPVDGVVSSDAIVIKGKQPEYRALVLATVSSDEFVAHATQTSQGTKMPRANWDILLGYATPLPPQSLLERFSDFVNPAVEQIRNLVLRTRALRRTRDLLLPKLVSGEIDVSGLEIDVGEGLS